MTKPALPPQIEERLPVEVVCLIYSFVPHIRKRKSPSDSLQRALAKLQQSPKRSAMDLYGFDDFVLA